jgi:hypothetical protein
VPVPGSTAARARPERAAVLDAVIELFSEDNLTPARGRRARFESRSGRCTATSPTPRSCWRRIDRHLEGWCPRPHPRHRRGPLDERIERFVTCACACTSHRPGRPGGRIAAARNEIIREQTELTRRSLRDQVERNFAPELRPLDARTRKAVAGAADALGQLETLDYYRIHRRLSSRDTADILTLSLARLLAP